MQPTGHLRGDAVRVAGDARQRFYDSRGYGRPLDGNEIELSRVEAAHLLFRGDLSGIALGADGDPVGFERFFVESAAATDRFAVRYLVYADLRDRGFYLSPAREPWPGGSAAVADAVDFVAYQRGSTPDTGDVKYPVQVVGERESLPAAGLAGRTLAVVDEESDITYFAAESGEIDGETDYEPPARLDGVLLSDRVVVWDAPERLYERGFYGQPLTGRAAAVEGALQLSLVEAASLAADGVLSLSASVGPLVSTSGTSGMSSSRSLSPHRSIPSSLMRSYSRAVLSCSVRIPRGGLRFQFSPSRPIQARRHRGPVPSVRPPLPRRRTSPIAHRSSSASARSRSSPEARPSTSSRTKT